MTSHGTPPFRDSHDAMRSMGIDRAGHPDRPPRDPEAVETARAFAIEVAKLAKSLHCENVVILDVTSVSEMTDFVVIASGTSDRQMRSVLDDVEELGEKAQLPVPRRNTDDRSLWLLADFVDVVVHLFEPNTRAHYDLESMWGEVPRVEWREDA